MPRSTRQLLRNKDVVVKKSNIHGFGVFAARNFKKGEAVLCWDVSHRLTKKEAQALSKKTQSYLNHDAQGRLVLLYSPERYLNHSCVPNTKVVRAADVAVRAIRKGEEITGDYGQEKICITARKCLCKSKKCQHVLYV